MTIQFQDMEYGHYSCGTLNTSLRVRQCYFNNCRNCYLRGGIGVAVAIYGVYSFRGVVPLAHHCGDIVPPGDATSAIVDVINVATGVNVVHRRHAHVIMLGVVTP